MSQERPSCTCHFFLIWGRECKHIAAVNFIRNPEMCVPSETRSYLTIFYNCFFRSPLNELTDLDLSMDQLNLGNDEEGDGGDSDIDEVLYNREIEEREREEGEERGSEEDEESDGEESEGCENGSHKSKGQGCDGSESEVEESEERESDGGESDGGESDGGESEGSESEVEGSEERESVGDESGEEESGSEGSGGEEDNYEDSSDDCSDDGEESSIEEGDEGMIIETIIGNHCFDITEYFEVERILDSRERKGVTEYLIKWKNYDASHNSWEPESNVQDTRYLLAKGGDQKRGNDNMCNSIITQYKHSYLRNYW